MILDEDLELWADGRSEPDQIEARAIAHELWEARQRLAALEDGQCADRMDLHVCSMSAGHGGSHRDFDSLAVWS